jgi:CubicO group peptidase (beta-lactamase class C family)
MNLPPISRTGGPRRSIGGHRWHRSKTRPKAWREGQWGPQILFAMGIHGQNVFVDRANRIVIAKVSSQNSPIDSRALWLTHKASLNSRGA